jgi:GNAT superfamily N-acetyltransferase
MTKKSPNLQIRQSLPLDQLIPSALIPLIQKPGPTRWIAFEAHSDGELAALSVAEIYPLNKIAKIHSVIIKENFTGKGIWKELFSFTQNHLLHEEKMRAIEWSHDQASPTAKAIETILASLGWPSPQLYLIRLHFESESFNPRWLLHPFSLPPDIHYFSWNKLTENDRETILYLEQQGRCLPYLSPLKNEEKIHLETSIGLRKNDRLIGWCITHLFDPSTLLYYSLFVDKDYLQTGFGIQLLVESIRRQQQLPLPSGIFEINLREIDPSWWRFVEKRLLPLATRVERIKRTFYLNKASI